MVLRKRVFFFHTERALDCLRDTIREKNLSPLLWCWTTCTRQLCGPDVLFDVYWAWCCSFGWTETDCYSFCRAKCCLGMILTKLLTTVTFVIVAVWNLSHTFHIFENISCRLYPCRPFWGFVLVLMRSGDLIRCCFYSISLDTRQPCINLFMFNKWQSWHWQVRDMIRLRFQDQSDSAQITWSDMVS